MKNGDLQCLLSQEILYLHLREKMATLRFWALRIVRFVLRTIVGHQCSRNDSPALPLLLLQTLLLPVCLLMNAPQDPRNLTTSPRGRWKSGSVAYRPCRRGSAILCLHGWMIGPLRGSKSG